jgi:hypothetical protein
MPPLANRWPTAVTKHGKPFVVIVSVADWRRSKPPKRTLLEMLRFCLVDLTELDLSRRGEAPRDLEQFGRLLGWRVHEPYQLITDKILLLGSAKEGD